MYLERYILPVSNILSGAFSVLCSASSYLIEIVAMGMVRLAHLFASWRPFSGHHHRVDCVFVMQRASLLVLVRSFARRIDFSFMHKVRIRLFVSSRAMRERCGTARGGVRYYFLLPFRFRNYTRFVDVTRYSPLSIYLRVTCDKRGGIGR